MNSRTIDNIFSNNTEHNASSSVIPNKLLYVYSVKNDSKHEIKLGQISGLATSITDPNQLFIFHRGSRQWNQQSFPDGYHFDTNKFGAIQENTIISIDTQTGEIINQWGNNTFYMPHGLYIDNQENIWLTDAAMHQVFKYKHEKLLLKLGELFNPGSDSSHFCKPTDVVVSNDGLNIYVADGYCNSRIMKFNSEGKFVKEYKMAEGEKQLFIPHSLVLIESLNIICVADRQNGRIVCFDTKDLNEGKVKYIIEHSSMNTVYAITYYQNRLYAVSGKDMFNEARGYTFSADPKSFGDLIEIWKPKNKFGEPHDLAISIDGHSLFVGEIRPNCIRLFNILN